MKTDSAIIKTTWPDQLSLAHAVAHFIVLESKKAIAATGQFSLALSGGSTPKLLYELLAEPPYANNIEWKKTIIVFGDERFVPHTSDESNFKMASEALLQKVPLLKKNVHAMTTSRVVGKASAKAYAQTLKQFVSAKTPISLVLLGIGEEGHTASIFPGSPLIGSKKNWVESVWVEEKKMERISFTLPFINKAANVAFLVAGAGKAEIIQKIFSRNNAGLPAAMVKARERTYWFLDDAANGT